MNECEENEKASSKTLKLNDKVLKYNLQKRHSCFPRRRRNISKHYSRIAKQKVNIMRRQREIIKKRKFAKQQQLDILIKKNFIKEKQKLMLTLAEKYESLSASVNEFVVKMEDIRNIVYDIRDENAQLESGLRNLKGNYEALKAENEDLKIIVSLKEGENSELFRKLSMDYSRNF